MSSGDFTLYHDVSFYGVGIGAQETFENLNSGMIYNYQGLGHLVAVESPLYNEGGSCQGDQRADILMASGMEAIQYFMNRVADRHCLTSPSWKRYCTIDGETYTPSISKPFQLEGYPTNVSGFWLDFKNNITTMGDELGYNWQRFPWTDTNSFGGTEWSGRYKRCEYTDGVYQNSGRTPYTNMYTYGHALKSESDKLKPTVNSYGTTSFMHLGNIRKTYNTLKEYPLTITATALPDFVFVQGASGQIWSNNVLVMGGACPRHGIFTSGIRTSTTKFTQYDIGGQHEIANQYINMFHGSGDSVLYNFDYVGSNSVVGDESSYILGRDASIWRFFEGTNSVGNGPPVNPNLMGQFGPIGLDSCIVNSGNIPDHIEIGTIGHEECGVLVYPLYMDESGDTTRAFKTLTGMISSGNAYFTRGLNPSLKDPGTLYKKYGVEWESPGSGNFAVLNSSTYNDPSDVIEDNAPWSLSYGFADDLENILEDFCQENYTQVCTFPGFVSISGYRISNVGYDDRYYPQSLEYSPSGYVSIDTSPFGCTNTNKRFMVLYYQKEKPNPAIATPFIGTGYGIYLRPHGVHQASQMSAAMNSGTGGGYTNALTEFQYGYSPVGLNGTMPQLQYGAVGNWTSAKHPNYIGDDGTFTPQGVGVPGYDFQLGMGPLGLEIDPPTYLYESGTGGYFRF